jgi:putative intracellular protease/amidase
MSTPFTDPSAPGGAHAAPGATTRIVIVLFDGFDELDAVGPFEVLTRAALAGAPLEVELACLSGPGGVLASHGLRVAVDQGLNTKADLLLVPGGGWNTQPGTPGVRAEVERGLLPPVIAAMHAQGATVASVCTGAMIVAASGLLEGRPAPLTMAHWRIWPVQALR